MFKFIKILILLFILAFYSRVFAQVEVLDSSINRTRSLSEIEKIPFKPDEFDLYFKIYLSDAAVPVSRDPNTMWLWTSAAISKSRTESIDKGSYGNVSKFLYMRYIEDSKFNPVRYVLGMAQLGAVGYLAYKHIEKYGFLK